MKIRKARPRDAEAIAKVHVASWQTTYAGILPASYLSSLSWQQRSDYWQDVLAATDAPHGVYVAEEPEDNVVGFADGGPERSGDPVYTGELYAIYLLNHSQRQGIGRALTGAIVRELLQRGLSSMLVWVLAANPSCAFYERLGGLRIREHQSMTGGIPLGEVAYGWRDISEMAHQLP